MNENTDSIPEEPDTEGHAMKVRPAPAVEDTDTVGHAARWRAVDPADADTEGHSAGKKN